MNVLAAFPLAAVSHSLLRWTAQLWDIIIWQSPTCPSYCKWCKIKWSVMLLAWEHCPCFFMLFLFNFCFVLFIDPSNLMSHSPTSSIICFLSIFLHLVLMKDRCKLFCRVAGTTAYYQLKDRVIDGTPCGPDTFDICVQGLCRVNLFICSFLINTH